jgi:hypothetical protein
LTGISVIGEMPEAESPLLLSNPGHTAFGGILSSVPNLSREEDSLQFEASMRLKDEGRSI